MKKNAYAFELQRKRELRELIIGAWTVQMAMDVWEIVLNDPDVMGKDVMGRKRLKAVCEAFNERFQECVVALQDHPEADYMRTKIDEALVRIFGEDAQPWPVRYDGWNERERYERRK